MSERSRRNFLKTAGGALLSSGMLSSLKEPLPALAAERNVGRTARPNILLLFPDQHRFDWLGTNPRLPVRTPNLDKMAERGVRFTRAMTPSPLCAPARVCLASGKAYDRCGVASNGVDYPLDQPTFYSMLRASGYWTTACGKLDLNKRDRNTGVDGKRFLKQWGFSDGINCLGKGDAVSSGKTSPTIPTWRFSIGDTWPPVISKKWQNGPVEEILEAVPAELMPQHGLRRCPTTLTATIGLATAALS